MVAPLCGFGREEGRPDRSSRTKVVASGGYHQAQARLLRIHRIPAFVHRTLFSCDDELLGIAASRPHVHRRRWMVGVNEVRFIMSSRAPATRRAFYNSSFCLQDWQASGVLHLASERLDVIAFDYPDPATRSVHARPFGGPPPKRSLSAVRRTSLEWSARPCQAYPGVTRCPRDGLDRLCDITGPVLISGCFRTARLDVPLVFRPAIPLIGDVMAHMIAFGRTSPASRRGQGKLRARAG